MSYDYCRRKGAAAVGAAGLGLLAVLAGGCAQKQSPANAPVAQEPAKPAAPTRDQLLAATVTGVLDTPVTLSGGHYEGAPAGPGAATKPTLTLWDSTIEFIDLDGKPPEEGVALLTYSGGGSGTYSGIGVFGMQDGKATSLGVVPLGDRVQLFRLWHEPGKVLVDVVEAGPGEPACCPTQLSRKAFGYKDGKLQQLESAAVGTVSVNLLGATDWMLVEMDGQPLAADITPPTAMIQYGKIAGFAGCNRYTAALTESAPASIKVGEVALTRKACDGPANDMEAAFVERLRGATAYSFVAGRLLVTSPSPKGAPRTLLFSR